MLDLIKFTNTATKIVTLDTKTNGPQTSAVNSSILVNVTRIVDEIITLKTDHTIDRDKTKATTISQEIHLNLHNSSIIGPSMRLSTNSIISSIANLVNSTIHNKALTSSFINKDPNNIMVVDNSISSKTSTPSTSNTTNLCLNPTSSINSIRLVVSSNSP